jgi:hypothetical protein
MKDSINLQLVKLLGWTVTKVAINEGHPNRYLNPKHPQYQECLDKHGFKYGMNSPSGFYSSATRKLYSGYNDTWFDTEEEAWKWLERYVYFDSDLNQAMSLFDNTGITVCLSQPPDNEEQYSASLRDIPAHIATTLYSVSSSWAESICMCWIKYKVEMES